MTRKEEEENEVRVERKRRMESVCMNLLNANKAIISILKDQHTLDM